MQVVLLSAEYPPTPGGVGDYAKCLGIALAPHVRGIQIWTIRAGMLCAIDPCHPDQPGTPVTPATWGWQSWGAIRASLHRFNPDILHIQYQTGAYGMHPAVNLLPTWLRLDRQRPRILVTAHDLLMPYLFPKAGPIRAWVTQHLLEDCDAAIVTNQEDAAALSGHAPTDAHQGGVRFVGRLRHVPEVIPIGSNITPNPAPGYQRETWRTSLGIAPDTTLLAYFGLISPTKGLDILLDALETIPADIRLLIIGGDSPAPQDRHYAERLRTRLASPTLAGRVMITGHCPPPEVSAHLLAADIAVLPFTDGATFRRGSLLAALSHGLPVITTWAKNQEPLHGQQHADQFVTASTGLTQAPHPPGQALLPALIDQDNVALVPVGDTASLAACIQQLTRNPAQRSRLAQGARTLMTAFSWDTIAEQHAALYTRILNSKNSS